MLILLGRLPPTWMVPAHRPLLKEAFIFPSNPRQDVHCLLSSLCLLTSCALPLPSLSQSLPLSLLPLSLSIPPLF